MNCNKEKLQGLCSSTSTEKFHAHLADTVCSFSFEHNKLWTRFYECSNSMSSKAQIGFDDFQRMEKDG